jgi:hypothetical protein
MFRSGRDPVRRHLAFCFLRLRACLERCCFREGRGWSGLTPYLRCLARPQGQPPRVTSISIPCRNLANRLPFLALVQIGQRDSQNSGLNMFFQGTGTRF